MKIFGLILGGGKSERFGSNKLNCKLSCETVSERSTRMLYQSEICDSLYYVSRSYNTPLESFVKFVEGGNTRFESMCNGVEEIVRNLKGKDEDIYVLIHNAANPGVTSREIQECLEMAKVHGAAAVASEIRDTIRIREKCPDFTPGSKKRTKSCTKCVPGHTFETLDRTALYAMQTPQCLRLDLLLKGIEIAKSKDFEPTDDVELIGLINSQPGETEHYVLIPASETNFKITVPEDLKKMRAVLNLNSLVGIGQDSHEHPTEGGQERLVLGGLKLKNFSKLKANSDGDVILHALFNAISSALSGGSLGGTADKMCRNGMTDSKEYLNVILEKMGVAGYEIGNLSVTLICEKPKIDPLTENLKKSLSEILKIDTNKIGITATTGEGTENFGKGIMCTCFVTLV
ncbi:2-C-methyl-D-erythritol 2,4-cyclodiphosphate synthase [Candidatus Peregrinibacteria bacterium]|jgi:2-C-methyl-D-erythritol 2,4-cyclodiphosphate synthase/2-C-methyl-D-erythritol 4-phosphate cytidylyltransferase|nr:2-C-methyl-D-erythritol 2,4-cyclodiphosphate synthase [Candidatus Peregrinibacteria bacterium]